MSQFTKLFQRSQYFSRNAVASVIGGLIVVALWVMLPDLGTASLTNNAALPPNADLLTVAQQEEDDSGEEAETADDNRIVALVEVVVAVVDIPVGERLRPELMRVEQRPSDNVAIRAGVTFSDISLLAGQVAKTSISEGQEIIAPMVAVSSTDLANIGSDLALFVDNQRVAVAFPIDRYSGLSYAMRPGDFVDVMMSFNMIELDVDFQTALPNQIELVDEDALAAGEPFLFPATSRGRLEVISELSNTIVQITPQQTVQTEELAVVQGEEGQSADDEVFVAETQQQPRRVTQLTVQQAEVLWLGTWDDPNLGVLKPEPAPGTTQPLLEDDSGVFGSEDAATSPQILIDPTIYELYRSSIQPDVVILSMPVQDALVIKWALEEPGTDVDLALRSQGDNALYFTTSVSLPQLVEQAGLSIPDPAQFDLQPRIDGASIPRLPAVNPEENVVPVDEQSGNGN